MDHQNYVIDEMISAKSIAARVEGLARVTREGEVSDLAVNQSTYIPIGVKHRLENPGDGPLRIIEIQSGAYLGEDDIVRFEDVYGRT